nr:TPA_asm: M25 uoORF RNA *1 [Murid betaherpesvirus 1]DBA07747.1 TPA_asm: M25 uoORF RNA *1 [Murid betaherpesvirus 1]
MGYTKTSQQKYLSTRLRRPDCGSQPWISGTKVITAPAGQAMRRFPPAKRKSFSLSSRDPRPAA